MKHIEGPQVEVRTAARRTLRACHGAPTDRANRRPDRLRGEGRGDREHRERAPWRTRTRSLDLQPSPRVVALLIIGRVTTCEEIFRSG